METEFLCPQSRKKQRESLQPSQHCPGQCTLEGSPSEVYLAVRWIQFVMATLSMIGASSIIVYAVLQNLVRTREIRPLFFLSVSDLMLGVCWLIGALLYGEISDTQNVACYNLQTTGQIFYVSSFLYTVNYTWCLYTDLKERYNQKLHSLSPLASKYTKRINRTAIILSSLIPFILLVPVFCMGNASECYQNFSRPHKCLLMHTGTFGPDTEKLKHESAVCHVIHLYGVGVFLSTFLFTFIGILVLLLKSRALYKRCVHSTGFLGDQQWAKINVIEHRVILYPAAFFFCWGPAILLAVLKLTDSGRMSEYAYVVLYILQAFTAASQGLLNCFVYGWTQQMFRCMKRKACRDVDTQTPLLRSQKRFYSSTQTTTTTSTSAIP
nr:PREDICTED: transmembrane protein 116 isoform X2 [Latimeria chalumnae]|eukprot:XP_005996452.1 PREDICTED: transmembrane protein 116 isoform X2 [Latimeria chalumnae]